MHGPLVGRTAELSELDEGLRSAASGRPATVLIGGEPGVGKTRLLAEFLGRARADGALVLRAGCFDLGGGALPYLPLQELLRALERDRGAATVREWAGPSWPELARLLPALSVGEREPAPAREGSQAQLMEAVLRVVEECAALAPTVLAIEDLHWLDRSTADLLLFLCRALTDQRVLVVGSYRSEQSPELRRVLTGLGGRRRELSPLGPAQIRELVDALVPADPRFAAEVARRSEGNAFFANELVAAGPTARSAVPVGVRDVVLARLDAAGRLARAVAGTIATAGRPVSHPLVEAAAPVPRDDLLAVLRECVHAQLLVVDADRYAFRHALALEAVYGDLLPGERSAHHRALAEVLDARPALRLPESAAAAAEVAHHWDLAGDPAATLAASVAAGGAAAAVFAYAEAEQQYDRALRLLPAVPDSGLDQAGLLNSAADAARWAGHVERAVELVERALAVSTAPGLLHERRGRYLGELGRTQESLAAYARACEVFAAQPPSKELVWALGGYATSLVQAGRLLDAVDRCREALRAADAVGAATEAGRARNTLGVALTMLGSPEEGITELRVAVAAAEEAGSLEDLLRGYANLGYALETAGRYEESLAATLEGVRRSRDLGLDATGGVVLLANAASVLTMLGRWDEAEEVADAARAPDTPAGFDPYRQLVLAELDIGRGRFAVASDRLGGAYAAARLQEPQFAGLLHALRAEAHLWQGWPDLALVAVRRGIAAVAAGEDKGQVLRLCALALRAEADLAQRRRTSPPPRPGGKEPESEFSAMAAAAAANPLLPWPAALWELCRAEHARAGGTATPQVWPGVADRWDALAQPYPAACARWRAAEAAVERGDRPTAVAELRTARRAAVALGAAPLLAEIDGLAVAARLVLHGRAVARAAPVPAAAFGLTPRERQVLALLCDGMSNRQLARTLFVTERTAAVHVSNIIAKLQVANRGQAAALALRTGLLTGP